jgi:hypothetical protein
MFDVSTPHPGSREDHCGVQFVSWFIPITRVYSKYIIIYLSSMGSVNQFLPSSHLAMETMVHLRMIYRTFTYHK